MSVVTFRYCLLTAVCGTTLLALGGCGGNTGTLSGKVTVRGVPLADGTVVVRGEKGEVVFGDIRNGEYTVKGAPLGIIKIAVTAAQVPREIPRGGGRGDPARAELKNRMATDAGQGEPVKYIADIPTEYQDPETSPITHDTSSGLVKDITIP